MAITANQILLSLKDKPRAVNVFDKTKTQSELHALIDGYFGLPTFIIQDEGDHDALLQLISDALSTVMNGETSRPRKQRAARGSREDMVREALSISDEEINARDYKAFLKPVFDLITFDEMMDKLELKPIKKKSVQLVRGRGTDTAENNKKQVIAAIHSWRKLNIPEDDTDEEEEAQEEPVKATSRRGRPKKSR